MRQTEIPSQKNQTTGVKYDRQRNSKSASAGADTFTWVAIDLSALVEAPIQFIVTNQSSRR